MALNLKPTKPTTAPEDPHTVAALNAQIAALDVRIGELKRDLDAALDDLAFALSTDELAPARIEAQIAVAERQRRALEDQRTPLRRAELLTQYKALCERAAVARAARAVAKEKSDKLNAEANAAYNDFKVADAEARNLEGETVINWGMGLTPADHRALAIPLLDIRHKAGMMPEEDYTSAREAAERAEQRLQREEKHELTTY
jgi:hypothetical protein